MKTEVEWLMKRMFRVHDRNHHEFHNVWRDRNMTECAVCHKRLLEFRALTRGSVRVRGEMLRVGPDGRIVGVALG